MLVGYMRVSSENERQNTDLQYDALINAGVDSRNIYQDKASTLSLFKDLSYWAREPKILNKNSP